MGYFSIKGVATEPFCWLSTRYKCFPIFLNPTNSNIQVEYSLIKNEFIIIKGTAEQDVYNTLITLHDSIKKMKNQIIHRYTINECSVEEYDSARLNYKQMKKDLLTEHKSSIAAAYYIETYYSPSIYWGGDNDELHQCLDPYMDNSFMKEIRNNSIRWEEETRYSKAHYGNRTSLRSNYNGYSLIVGYSGQSKSIESPTEKVGYSILDEKKGKITPSFRIGFLKKWYSNSHSKIEYFSPSNLGIATGLYLDWSCGSNKITNNIKSFKTDFNFYVPLYFEYDYAFYNECSVTFSTGPILGVDAYQYSQTKNQEENSKTREHLLIGYSSYDKTWSNPLNVLWGFGVEFGNDYIRIRLESELGMVNYNKKKELNRTFRNNYFGISSCFLF